MKKILKRTCAAVLCCTMLLGFVRPVQSYAATDYDSLRAVFDPEYYYNQYPDLQESVGKDGEMLFQHFVSTGIREGRSGIEAFNLKAYVFYNEDLLNVYKTDISGYCRHYLEQGKDEGRISTPQENKTNKIGTYHTSYDNTLPRAVNVELAAQRINGVVLQPGQGFSFSNTVQSRVPKNGYVMAPAIGGYEYGGGICQVSSTLYAAMCHALLPATERHPHSSRVSYLPVGMDATISEGYKDLKFVNIYHSPLIIESTYGEGILTVSLWLGEIQNETTEEVPTEQTEEQPNEENLNQEESGEEGQSEPEMNPGESGEEGQNQQEMNPGESGEEGQNQQEMNPGEPSEKGQNQPEMNQEKPSEEGQNQEEMNPQGPGEEGQNQQEMNPGEPSEENQNQQGTNQQDSGQEETV